MPWSVPGVVLVEVLPHEGCVVAGALKRSGERVLLFAPLVEDVEAAVGSGVGEHAGRLHQDGRRPVYEGAHKF